MKNQNEVFVNYLNKDNNYKADRKYFKSYEDAVKIYAQWAKSNFESFNPDMINYT